MINLEEIIVIPPFRRSNRPIGWVFIYNMEKEIICGIYKITSPTGRIYIGQSTDVDYRIKTYKGIFKAL